MSLENFLNQTCTISRPTPVSLDRYNQNSYSYTEVASDVRCRVTEKSVIALDAKTSEYSWILATVLLLVSQAPERRMEWIAALCVTMAVSAVVLVLAERIQRIAGERFVMALERLMGLVLVAVSIEMMLRGIKTFATQLASP